MVDLYTLTWKDHQDMTFGEKKQNKKETEGKYNRLGSMCVKMKYPRRWKGLERQHTLRSLVSRTGETNFVVVVVVKTDLFGFSAIRP